MFGFLRDNKSQQLVRYLFRDEFYDDRLDEVNKYLKSFDESEM